MEAKHTPGPWTSAGYNVEAGEVTYTFHNDGAKAGELRANARLISVAPELLEQLEKSVAILGAIMDKLEVTPPEKCQKDFIEMVETIKKARGEV
jgi:hypothetical protein|tara:strand:- start:954 stop:1235 length:282 start_codon:yes stop_codon:yes gene_type:complete